VYCNALLVPSFSSTAIRSIIYQLRHLTRAAFSVYPQLRNCIPFSNVLFHCDLISDYEWKNESIMRIIWIMMTFTSYFCCEVQQLLQEEYFSACHAVLSTRGRTCPQCWNRSIWYPLSLLQASHPDCNQPPLSKVLSPYDGGMQILPL